MINPRGSSMHLNAMDPSQQYYGLPATVASSVQNGFAPLPDMTAAGTSGPDGAPGGRPAVPEGAPPIAENPVTAAPPETAPPPRQPTPQELAAKAKFDASPEGIQHQADIKAAAAIDKERQANADASTAEQAQNTATAAAEVEHQKRVADEAKLYAAKQAQHQANIDKYTTQYAQQIKDAANFKVDTDRHISNAGLFAMALSGTGDALDHRHGPNAAFEIISNGIDKRIADQWAQKKALGETADQTKGVLDMYRRNADDDRQGEQFQIAAESAKAASDLRLVASQTANPKVAAAAEKNAALLDQKSVLIGRGEAERKAAAIAAEQAQANERAKIGAEYAKIAEQKRQFDQNFALQVAERQQAAQAAAAKYGQEVGQFGLMRASGTNDDGSVHYEPLMQEGGKAPYVPDKEVSAKMKEVYTGTALAVSAFDRMREKRSHFDSDDQFANWVSSTDAGRALMQDYAGAILGLHKASGINRFSGEVVKLSEDMITGGIDPTSVKAVLPSLDRARANALDTLNITLHKQGNYTGRSLDDKDFPDITKATRPEPKLEDIQLKRILSDTPNLSTTRGHGEFRETKEAVEIHPDTHKGLDNLVYIAGHGQDPKDREQALEKLNTIGKEAKSKFVRQAAYNGIHEAQTASLSNEQIGPTTQTQNLQPSDIIGAKK
jgi:hypothetical protein